MAGGRAPIAIRQPESPLPKRERPHLRDLDRDALATFIEDALGGPRYRADQIFEWLHRHRVATFDAMTNVGKAQREQLAGAADLDRLEVDEIAVAADGTRKLRLRTGDGYAVESVLIPNEDRGLTLCVSSMVGCSLTCSFCATASMGFIRNLATHEIVDQVYAAQDVLARAAEASQAEYPGRITNIVLMGMGEPLHNYNQVSRALAILRDQGGAGIGGRRITVSTAGLVPAIERFAREGLGGDVGLAVSLNATTDEVRDRLMPINRRWNIAALLAAVRAVPSPRRRRLTFEYVLLADINDTDEDAQRLATLVDNLDCQINVIPFNPHPHATFRRPSPQRVERFTELLRARHQKVHLRRPRGDDIAAACGQLALEDS